MKKFSNKDVLRKFAELEGKQSQKVSSFTDFRRQFDEYQRAKTGRKVRPKSVCRPYVEVFSHHRPLDRKQGPPPV